MYTQDDECDFDCGEVVKQANDGFDDIDSYVTPTIDFQSEGIDSRADSHVAAEPGSANLSWNLFEFALIFLICSLVFS